MGKLRCTATVYADEIMKLTNLLQTLIFRQFWLSSLQFVLQHHQLQLNKNFAMTTDQPDSSHLSTEC